jgi:membrane protein implicated in regulation of membrane protease activity
VGAHSRASLRGAEWTIVNGGTDEIAAGSRVKVVRSEGLTLYVTGDQS